MIHEVKIPIFDVTVFLVVDPDPVAARSCSNLVKIFGPNEDGEDWDGIYLTPVRDNFCIIFSKGLLTHNLFAHELHHLMKGIIDWREIDDEETEALLSGYLHSTLFPLVEDLL